MRFMDEPGGASPVDPFAAPVDPFAAKVDPFAGDSPRADPQGMDAFGGMTPPGEAATVLDGKALREWEKKQDEAMAKFAQEEMAQKKTTREAASKDLQKWYAERKEGMKVGLGVRPRG